MTIIWCGLRVDLRETCHKVQRRCTRSPVTTNQWQQTLVRLLWSSMSSNVTQLVMAWEESEGTQKQSRENHYACSKVENLTQLRLFIHHSAWCIGRNFCGYLILRFFPNRKNSQNIVPANNSNNKVHHNQLQLEEVTSTSLAALATIGARSSFIRSAVRGSPMDFRDLSWWPPLFFPTQNG